MTATLPALAAHGVSVVLDHATLIDDVDLHALPGEWLCIIGPNGAGKSTLLRAVAGLLRCTGQVSLQGKDITRMPRREIARQIAVVAQNPAVPTGTTVTDYVLLGRTPHLGPLHREGPTDRQVVSDVLDRLHLAEFAGRMLGSMSGGELQRVFIARALAQEPTVLLLDEPTSALDIGHQQEVLEVIDELRRGSALTVISTMHDLTLAAEYADRLMLMHRGKVVTVGAPLDVLRPDTLRATYGAHLDVLLPPEGSPQHGPIIIPVRRTRG
ncbi:iron complex transport system ATP-binding protein [Antricoccus suffuscus]|uniref:Iron complex transport system ATP-binding protein n=1 Tax=Antricoccus suffuscus TaxID=1629062 RepID=A0A2T1A3K4_9ACTN|nr:ABC transporter ATP-binding protein [Antricoccus suffuscus]PRZ43182.1 iron complex transport system ATP-binding protein [Antricoccus suffuscus]